MQKESRSTEKERRRNEMIKFWGEKQEISKAKDRRGRNQNAGRKRAKKFLEPNKGIY